MAASTTSNNDIVFEVENEKNADAFKNSTDVIKSNLVSYFAEVNKDADFTGDYNEIINLTSLSIKKFANAGYKTSPFLESRDIDQIKTSLDNYASRNETLYELKNELIEDLTNFQTQIKANHFQRIDELIKQKQHYEKQIKVTDFAKHKLVMDRLSKIVWPYDAQTKEYDIRIAKLEIQIKQCEQKIETLRKMRPVASEKDIILYQMHLKEKYANK